MWLVEQICWTGTQITNDLKASVSRFGDEIRHEIVKWFASLSNRLSATKKASSQELSLVKPSACNVVKKRDVGRGCKSGARQSNVEGSSTWYAYWLSSLLTIFRIIFWRFLYENTQPVRSVLYCAVSNMTEFGKSKIEKTLVPKIIEPARTEWTALI